ncbi:MAG: hypothetical protein CFH37_00925 [Alphaproteobacteria bacterium MarineAlpha9_Bin7]|nr:MAG: hypothetical protein CFH37_00925 [Alphaproteobacteria bacterium MarineAlpha9_Bin7]
MSRNALETLIGSLVLVVALWFVVFAYSKSDLQTVSGYTITAKFSSIWALAEGVNVKVNGIKVESIFHLGIDPEIYLAEVTMVIDEKIKLPLDTMAGISAEGLLGGHYVRLDPGGEEDLVGTGGKLIYTHDAADIIGLIS